MSQQRSENKLLRALKAREGELASGKEYEFMDEVYEFLETEAGVDWIMKWLEPVCRYDPRLMQFKDGEVDGFIVPLDAILVGCPQLPYKLIVSNKQERKARIGRYIGPDEMPKVSADNKSAKEIETLEKTQASVASFDRILNQRLPVVGEPEAFVIEMSDGLLTLAAMEILRSDQIAKENPMAAYAIHKGLMEAINQERK